ncbi:MAG TPA: hypothetical protein VG101_17890 [Puia sp.]|jgi:hypothetical protein|nr:hypothetical protein [Puia sp.]
MDNHSETFTPQESLQVIQTMIDQAKSSVADKSFYFLLWGWLVFIGAIGQYVLKVIVRTDRNPMVWLIMFIGVIVSAIYSRRERIKMVKTYVDEGLRNIWSAIAIAQGLIVLIFMRRGDWEHCYTIFILTYSIGCYLTGRLLQFRPLVWGARFCWVLAIVTTYVDVDMNILLLAAAILGSYIIPGYMLRAKYKHQLQKK